MTAVRKNASQGWPGRAVHEFQLSVVCFSDQDPTASCPQGQSLCQEDCPAQEGGSQGQGQEVKRHLLTDSASVVQNFL